MRTDTQLKKVKVAACIGKEEKKVGCEDNSGDNDGDGLSNDLDACPGF